MSNPDGPAADEPVEVAVLMEAVARLTVRLEALERRVAWLAERDGVLEMRIDRNAELVDNRIDRLLREGDS